MLHAHVEVTNTGNAAGEEVVQLYFGVPGSPVERAPKQLAAFARVALRPGETKTVTFQVGALVPFGEEVSVKVDVDPVQGETNTANNTAEYPVIFSL